MRSILYIGIILGLYNTKVNAQSLSFEWAKSCGSSNTDVATSVVVDHAGNVITTGIFNGMVDFDPGTGVSYLTSVGQEDIYIQKLDPNGNFLWAKRMGGNSVDYGLSITIDNDNNIYSTGYYRESVDFDPGLGAHVLTSEGGADVYIQKLTSDGDFVWAKSVGGVDAFDIAYSIKTDNSGNVYTTGAFGNAVDFNPGTGIYTLSSEGGHDIFIQKLDTSGNFEWAKRMGSSSTYDIGYALSLDGDGNVYTTGVYRNTVDFDPGVGEHNLTSNGGNDMFIQKLNTDGDFVWVKSFGGTEISDVTYAITLDDNGNIYTTGGFAGTVDFDPGTGVSYLNSEGADDAFIQKLDASGNFLWVKQMGGSLKDIGRSIAVDELGSIYVSGYFRDTLNVDTTTLISHGGDDMFVQKLDALGHLRWIHHTGSSSHDRGLGLALSMSGDIYTSGYFSDTVDFNFGSDVDDLISIGGYESFLQKMNQCYSSVTDVHTACDAFTWIDGQTYTSSNNQAIHTLTDVNGCDSVIKLNLTLPEIDNTISATGYSVTSNENGGATYQWLKCHDNYLPISGETNQTFTATQNGSYAVEITKGSCIDTSECMSIQPVGIEEETDINSISIYPNPTHGKVVVNTNGVQEVSINVFNTLGQNVYRNKAMASTQIEFNLPEPKGIYIVELKVDNNVKQYKLIKE